MLVNDLVFDTQQVASRANTSLIMNKKALAYDASFDTLESIIKVEPEEFQKNESYDLLRSKAKM